MASPMPEYDEVSDEDFRGPFGPGEAEGYDEAWDDAYEAQAAALFNDGVGEPPLEHLASPGVGSDFTQTGHHIIIQWLLPHAYPRDATFPRDPADYSLTLRSGAILKHSSTMVVI